MYKCPKCGNNRFFLVDTIERHTWRVQVKEHRDEIEFVEEQDCSSIEEVKDSYECWECRYQGSEEDFKDDTKKD